MNKHPKTVEALIAGVGVLAMGALMVGACAKLFQSAEEGLVYILDNEADSSNLQLASDIAENTGDYMAV